MMDDKELNRMLGHYTVPKLDPDLVTLAVHNALNAAPPQKLRRKAAGLSLLFRPFPSFVMGGMAAMAAMVLVVLPVMGLQIRQDYSVDSVISDLAATEQTAENDVEATDQIFSMLDVPQSDDGQQIDNLLRDQSDDAPIWDTFMGRT